jgi:hypothetical protein
MEPDEEWRKEDVKNKCNQFYERANKLQPPVNEKENRVKGTGASGAMKSADWAKELLRLSRLVRESGRTDVSAMWAAMIVSTLYEGSSSEMCKKEPQWPESLLRPSFTEQPGRKIYEHIYDNDGNEVRPQQQPQRQRQQQVKQEVYRTYLPVYHPYVPAHVPSIGPKPVPNTQGMLVVVQDFALQQLRVGSDTARVISLPNLSLRRCHLSRVQGGSPETHSAVLTNLLRKNIIVWAQIYGL